MFDTVIVLVHCMVIETMKKEIIMQLTRIQIALQTEVTRNWGDPKKCTPILVNNKPYRTKA